MENNKKTLSYSETFKFTLRALKIWWNLCPGIFLSDAFCSIVQSASPFITIWISAQLINELAGNRNPDELFKWVAIQLITSAALTLLGGILKRWSEFESTKADYLNECTYVEKTLKLVYADVDNPSVYDLYSQVRQNEYWAGWGLYRVMYGFHAFITSAIQIICGIILSISLFTTSVPSDSTLVFLNHPLCIIVLVCFMILITMLAPFCGTKANDYWSKTAADARLGNRAFTFYGLMSSERERATDLRMYNQQENVCSIYLKRNNAFGVNSKIAKYARGPMGIYIALSESVSVILVCAVYIFVCLKAWAGAFGVGSITQYVGAITNLFLGISSLLQLIGELRINAEFLEPCFEFLDLPNPMYQGSLTTEKRADRQYEVEFKDVSFKYPGTDTWALRHVNMKFKVGSRLAVVGMNGSGKTTFIKLLCRLYDPTEGQILLNGIDIRKYRYDDYIDIFSVVFQDFKLLALPLGENVAGAAKYDKERVLKCLKDAGFDERMESMPNGLETYLYKDLDKEGVEVSGGEAQKIAIARALYKDAPFIILDEPTAALDPIAEAEIYSKFNDIVGDKTAIYISHRLSSCRFCDDILVFHEGGVIQQGSHESLVADIEGKYFELWNAQAQYYV